MKFHRQITSYIARLRSDPTLRPVRHQAHQRGCNRRGDLFNRISIDKGLLVWTQQLTIVLDLSRFQTSGETLCRIDRGDSLTHPV